MSSRILTTFLLVCLCILCPVDSFAQLPTAPGTTWKYGSYDYLYNPPDPFWFYPPHAFTDSIIGDTTINGENYHHVVRSGEINGSWYFRQNGKKVWRLDSIGMSQNIEHLIMDFDWDQGDTIFGPYPVFEDFQSQPAMKSLQFGWALLVYPTTFINGAKQLNIQIEANQHVFLENVGILAFEFQCLAFGCPDPNYYLVTLKSQDSILYMMDNMTAISDPVDYVWEVSPNPFTDRIRLKVEGNGGEGFTGRLYDLSGRILASWEGLDFGQYHELSTGDLPRGTYWLEIENKGQKTGRKLIRGE